MHHATEKRIILLVASLGSFLVPYTVSSIAVALPALSEAFAVDAITLGWLVTAYMLTAAMAIVPVGRLADIHGRKRVFILGTALFTAGSFLAALSTGSGMLIGARVLQGVGGAMIFATCVALVTVAFPPGERGRALGINVAAVYAGLSVGPFLGGLLTQWFGWPSIFLVNVPVGLAVIVLTARGVGGEWAEARGQPFDRCGGVLYAAMIGAAMLGLNLLPSAAGAACLAASGLVLAGFVRWERRAAFPLIDLSLFAKNITFLCSNLAAMINYSAVFGVSFLLSLYLQYVRGFEPGFTGLLLVAQPLVQMLVSPAAGHLSDRWQPRTVATLGMGVTAAGLAFFAGLAPDTPLAWIVAGLAVLGLGYGIFSSPNTNAIMSSVAPRHLGTASGMVATMRAVGQTASLAIAMVVIAVVVGNVRITPERSAALLSAVDLCFVVFFVLAVLGVGASWARNGMKRP
jgi:EmrB/QacA subfamily drug resistance transporter